MRPMDLFHIYLLLWRTKPVLICLSLQVRWSTYRSRNFISNLSFFGAKFLWFFCKREGFSSTQELETVSLCIYKNTLLKWKPWTCAFQRVPQQMTHPLLTRADTAAPLIEWVPNFDAYTCILHVGINPQSDCIRADSPLGLSSCHQNKFLTSLPACPGCLRQWGIHFSCLCPSMVTQMTTWLQ